MASDVREIRIGLLWHSASSGNLGVQALTVANMAIAREVAASMGLAPRFVVFGMRDEDRSHAADPSVPVFIINGRSMASPRGYWRQLGALDCVLDIGAGDSFADIYAAKRFAYIWLTKALAFARRTPLLLSPQTIGPFTRSPYKQLAADAMRRAVAVVARDRASLAVAQALAPRANTVLSCDVAFVLPFEDRSAARGGAKLRVGVNASGLLWGEAVSGRNGFGLTLDYVDFTRRLLTALAAREDVEIHLVTHATTAIQPHDDDGYVADLLAAEFPGAIRLADFAGPSEAKSYISGLDFLVAGRMHACIGAHSAGTPVVPIAYSRKFDGVFDMLDYRWMVPVKGMDTGQALAYVLDALDRRGELAADEARGMPKVQALLDAYRGALRETFARATAKR